MSLDLPNTIDDWFRRLDNDLEFVYSEPADSFYIVGPSQAAASPIYVYATKPSCVLPVKRQYPEFNTVGIITRPGLPNAEHMGWLRALVEHHELMYLGDMDPVDLLVFAWLRAYLDLSQVTYLGISDAYMNQLGVVVPEAFIMSCTPSEQQSLSFLETVLPDFRELVGPVCASLLEDGRKIELEAVISHLGPPGPLLLPALVRLS